MPKIKPMASACPGVRRYGTKSRYTCEDLQRILDDIKNGKISQREASKKYDIPRNTLRNKLTGQHMKKVGRPTVFSAEEELSFVKHIVSLSDLAIPVSLCDVRCIAKSYLDSQNRKVAQFKGNMPGWEWSQSFLERHRAALKQKFGTNISRKRAQVSEETLNQFFDNLKEEVDGVPACNIFNFDETGFHDIPQKRKLLFKRVSRHPERIRNSTKSCYTTLFCGSADGNFIPPYVIMKGTQKWSDWVYGAPEGTRLNTSKSGWIDNQLFDDWFENHFLPVARQKPGKKILIGDNMSAHVSLKALKIAQENDIHLIFFPPNSTHLLQPLDVAYFSSMKTHWRQVLASWRETKGGKKAVALPKAIFCQLLKATLEIGEQTASVNLTKGFQCTGIHPLNKHAALRNLPLYAKSDEIVNENIGSEFKKYLENIRNNDLAVIHRARKFCLPIIAGKSVSVEEVEKFYENKAMSEAQKMNGKGRGRARTRGRRPKSSTIGTLGRQQKKSESPELDDAGDSSTISFSEERKAEQMLDYGDLTGVYTADIDVEDVTEEPETVQLVAVEHINEAGTSYTEHASVVNVCYDIYKVDDYVIIQYDGEMYPGQIIDLKDNMFLVRCMRKSGAYWKWPNINDDLWYEKSDVFKKLSPENITPASSRGDFQINDSLFGAKLLV